MPIIIRLDVVMAKNKIRSKDLAEIIGITEANLSLLKNGKIKGFKIETLEKLCRALNCQPGDLLEFSEE
ncbi:MULTISPECIES: helix-turn-helix domain-containing protein [Pseudomonas]|jgi:putative transcriptional regulator|uniref:Cro/CI family transcriptional regulator n=3 Tax=Pseudomonas TaxID=286 RepID=A0A077F259_9PSED|nr:MULTISPECIES: helix-turn-helix transcriptional regulator [Pseudomonas]HWD32687.1 helix-turn-helix transcriptional regulator [Pseudomonas sp.]AIL59542.1 Cro/CI family transcriptional regulator [Pseudomonas alkylphenolica]MBM3108123.1 helix-turn-helix transcriptional regulator [Pseudomonas arcuscaelestis]MBM3113830.1 helix-turn-helix transcriptional regulator [Pseudomonas arcuscaelestis]MBM5457425.1 helix-turn-helix transcriptional regulator [Pseudomonas arcuscaelestis]